MKKCRIVFDFLRQNDGILENRSLFIATAMTNNPHFTETVPGLEELKALSQEYTVAMVSAQNRDRLKISEKNDLRIKLETVLVSIGNYAMAVAKGSKTILLSTGYTVTSGAVSTVEEENIKNFAVEQGNISGQVFLSSERVKRAVSHTFYYGIAEGDNTIFEHVLNTKASVELNGLQPGKTYSFYMKAVAAKDKIFKSDTITKMVF